MRRLLVLSAVVALFALPLFAVDPGRAEGSLTIDGNRIPLLYAYAANHQKNQLTNRNDDTMVVLTDKPLPDGTRVPELDQAFPDGIYGVVICYDRKNYVSHVVVQHATGSYDAGYFDGEAMKDYTFKSRRGESGQVSGSVTSKRIKTNTMTFTFEGDFAASLQ